MIYTTRFITKAAVIAVLYTAVTMLLMPISYGLVQFRVSEAFMLLAALTPSAIPGLFVGCILANFFGGFGFIDIAFGSLATLMAAYATYFISSRISGLGNGASSADRSWTGILKVLLLPLPTIIFNGLIVGGYLPFIIPEIRGMASNLYLVLAMCIGSVMLGEAVVTYAIGIPLYYGIRRTGIFRYDLNEKLNSGRVNK